jgi:hypothetical protein
MTPERRARTMTRRYAQVLALEAAIIAALWVFGHLYR